MCPERFPCISRPRRWPQMVELRIIRRAGRRLGHGECPLFDSSQVIVFRPSASAIISRCSSLRSIGPWSACTSCSIWPSALLQARAGRTSPSSSSPQERAVVAGGHLDGGHHLRRRYAAGGDRPGGQGRHRGQLAVVELRAGGMSRSIFYARLWRRAGVMTDIEFAEIRYAGAPAAFLRGISRASISRFPSTASCWAGQLRW